MDSSSGCKAFKKFITLLINLTNGNAQCKFSKIVFQMYKEKYIAWIMPVSYHFKQAFLI